MSLVCELYRVDDSLIEDILKDPDWGYNYICEQYVWVSSPQNLPGDTIFSMDKAWSVTKFLFSKFIATKGVQFDILGQKANAMYSGSDDLYVVKSKDVDYINSIIEHVEVQEIAQYFDTSEVQDLYAGDWVENDAYLGGHVQNVKNAYRAAALHRQGIVSRIG